MNVALIILIIIILLIGLYFIYYIGFSAQSLFDLTKSNTSIANKDITNPKSTSFSYSMWLYVNNWNSNVIKEIIVAKHSNTTVFRIYLDAATPTLKTDIYTKDTTSTNKTKTVTITNNFPIQRWVYIVVSVEGTVVDCYLDGKLVKSQQLGYLPDMSSGYSINYGVMDGYLTKFARTAKPRDPQSVWTSYMAGNGFSPNFGPAFGFSFELTKDQNPIAKYEYK
jgi:hypothetical protein